MNKEDIRRVLKFRDEMVMKKQEMTLSLLKFSQKFSKKYDEVTPFHIFLIDLILAGRREIDHSRFLYKLLSYKEDGKYPILESFCNKLLGFNLTIINPTIEREKGNIDISVQDKDYFLIIENKVNSASDQPNQLARYINTAKEKMKDIKKIYICYLPYNDEKKPEENSWENPGKSPISYKNAFKDRFKIVAFRNEILEWLTNTLQINDEKKILQVALEQYAYLNKTNNNLKSKYYE